MEQNVAIPIFEKASSTNIQEYQYAILNNIPPLRNTVPYHEFVFFLKEVQSTIVHCKGTPVP